MKWAGQGGQALPREREVTGRTTLWPASGVQPDPLGCSGPIWRGRRQWGEEPAGELCSPGHRNDCFRHTLQGGEGQHGARKRVPPADREGSLGGWTLLRAQTHTSHCPTPPGPQVRGRAGLAFFPGKGLGTVQTP